MHLQSLISGAWITDSGLELNYLPISVGWIRQCLSSGQPYAAHQVIELGVRAERIIHWERLQISHII